MKLMSTHQRQRAAWLAFVLSACMSPGALALSESECVSLIERAKILSADSRVQVRAGSKEIAVAAYRNPKATDKDCKIDSILMAKVLMDADPKGITLVKVRFYDPTNRSSYREVRVGTGVVKAFGEGRVSQDELLSSVALDRGEQDINRYRNQSYQEITRGAEVVDGVYRGERLALLGRIQILRDRGVGVQPFLGEFFRIEDKVRQGDDSGVRAGLQYLDGKLSEQEERYRQAHGSHAQQARPYASQSVAATSSVVGATGHSSEGVLEAIRRELGDMAPQMGPQLKRRYRIARRIRELEAEGKVVDPYKSIFRECEQLAATGQTNALKMKLRYGEHQLGLPSFDEE